MKIKTKNKDLNTIKLIFKYLPSHNISTIKIFNVLSNQLINKEYD